MSTKDQCRKFIEDIENCNYFEFADMMNRISQMFIIRFDYINWERSTCTCRKWLKYYRCSHVIVLASRLPNAASIRNYVDIEDDIFKMMKITRTRRQGRPKNIVGALSREPNELQSDKVGALYFVMMKLNLLHQLHSKQRQSTSQNVVGPLKRILDPKRLWQLLLLLSLNLLLNLKLY